MIKFLISIFLFLVIDSVCISQSWEKYYGTSKMEEANDLIVTSDNSYLATANAGDDLYDRKNLYIVKTDTSGNIKWTKYLNTNYSGYFYILESPDHFYYFSSYKLLIKMTEQGDIVWTKSYTDASEQCDSYSNRVLDASGNLLGVGNKKIITYSKETGDVLSTKTFSKGYFTYIFKNSSGDYVIGGNQHIAPGLDPDSAYFIGLSANLDSMWVQSLSCNTSGLVVSQIIESNNQYLIASHGCNSYVGATNCWYGNSNFFALSTSGKVIENFRTGGGYSDFESLALKADGSMIGFGSYGYDYPTNLSFFGIDTVTNQLTYPSSTMRFDIALGKKIIALGNDRFLALASTKTLGQGIMNVAILKFGTDLITNTNVVSGTVIFDVSKNCASSSSNSLAGEMVMAYSPSLGKVYTHTDAYGKYLFRLPLGDYKITHVPSRYKYLNCPSNGYTVSITDTTPVISNKNFYDTTFIPEYAPFLKVDISSSARKRPCFKDSYSIMYKNLGSQIANNVTIELTLDSSITLVSASKPFTKNHNTYTFPLGNLAAKYSNMIYITDSIACVNALQGQTMCAKVKISYDTLYSPSNLNWDRSSVIVSGYCDRNDSVRFIIKNVGQNMTGFSQYRLYESDGLRQSGPFQLNQDDSLIISVYANGATYRLEADQREGYPDYSNPNAVIEACGTGIKQFPSGYVTTRTLDDERYTYDEVCSILVNSYDPNEKSVVPQGVTESHFIKDNVNLKYHIDFQNTGSDLAYTVVLRDTLSPFLDPSTLIMDAASHSYEWEIAGNGILTFTFNNINLESSAINEIASHGYITFEIAQMPGNAPNTVIKNKAAIYFDYNDPIFTNETFNTVNNDTIPSIPASPEKYITSIVSSSLADMIRVYPNPARETAVFEFAGKSIGNFCLVITDISGKEVFRKESIEGDHFEYTACSLTHGIYFYKVYDINGKVGNGKIIIVQ